MEGPLFDAYARILKATDCDGIEDLARRLGISPTLISDSRRRGEVSPEILLALLEKEGLSPEWIRTGKGRPYFCASSIQIALMAGRGLFPAEEEQSPAPPQTALSDEQKLTCIKLCTNFDYGRGIWKQIDENRELIQFLFNELLEQFNVSPQWVRTGEGEQHFIISVDKIASLYGMKLYSPRRTDGREQ